MSKEKELLKKCVTVLGHIRNDDNMALDDTWDRSDDGFMAELDLIEPLLSDIESHDKALYDEGIKEPDEYWENLQKDKEDEDA